MIPVTKSFMPSLEEYNEYLSQIWNSGILTNQGPLLRQLEDKIKGYLNINNFHLVSNGTIAIQLAINALDIYDGEIITTPFSFVATTTTILWERCTPVFVDIDEDNFCIDVNKIEEKITDKTKAILAVHVFGYACNVEKIEEIAKKYNLKVIYDGAHAFGSRYMGKSLLDYGDITTCSFHATKVFHTIEGGACIVKSSDVNRKMELIKKFGFEKEDYITCGINAKNSEFHAAMGLCNIKYIDDIIEKRKKICDLYDLLLNDSVKRPKKMSNLEYNYSYYPIVLESEEKLLKVINELNKNEIYPRRYFYPTLNTLEYLKQKYSCPISEDISTRIICLPLYVGLEEENIYKICKIIKDNL